MDYVVVHTTIDSEGGARALACEAVTCGLAACVQIVPIESVYQWQGKLETSREFRCEMKTRGDRAESLRKLIHEHHTYDLPEIVEVELRDLSSEYRSWMDKQLG